MDRRSLVLLHPLGADRSFWDPLIGHLTGLRVRALDLPGHGAAPLPAEGLTIARAADAVLAELDRDGGGPVDLLGLSIGGLVAQHIAAHDPERVGRLVLADTVARYPESLREQWRSRARTARTAGTAAFVEPTLQTWFTPGFADSGAAAVRYARTAIAGCDPEGYAQACEALEAADTRPYVARIVVPTLVLCGRDDGPAFVEGAEWLARTIPEARLEWVPGKHACAVENPTAVAAVLRAFLGSRDEAVTGPPPD